MNNETKNKKRKKALLIELRALYNDAVDISTTLSVLNSYCSNNDGASALHNVAYMLKVLEKNGDNLVKNFCKLINENEDKLPDDFITNIVPIDEGNYYFDD